MQKQRKFNPKKTPHKFQGRKKSKAVSWQPVKLNGPVIADEGADFGGFVGLEILENYSGDFVRQEKKKKNHEETELPDKKKKSKRKRSIDSDDESDSDEETRSKKKQKKTKKKKTAKPKEADSSEDDSGFDDQPKKKVKPIKQNVVTKQNKDEEHDDEEAAPAFSMLLKKPPTIKQQPKLQDAGTESVASVSLTNASIKQEKKLKQDAIAARSGESSQRPGDSSKNAAQKKGKQNQNQAKPAKPEAEPYSSVDYMAWTQLGVSEPIVRALADKGFKVPTEIQNKSLPVAIYGRRDLLGAAETGSGKTLAFGIPMLEGIMRMKKAKQQRATDDSSEHELTPPPEDIEMTEEDEQVFAEEGGNLNKNYIDTEKPLYGLILTPTRELAVQINDHLKA